jgi:hypothetical protein
MYVPRKQVDCSHMREGGINASVYNPGPVANLNYWHLDFALDMSHIRSSRTSPLPVLVLYLRASWSVLLRHLCTISTVQNSSTSPFSNLFYLISEGLSAIQNTSLFLHLVNFKGYDLDTTEYISNLIIPVLTMPSDDASEKIMLVWCR